MLTVSEAQQQILQTAQPLRPRTQALEPDALGLVLAEDVASDLDMPPHDKSLMDGYAVRCSDLEKGSAQLVVIEEVVAGQVPTKSIAAGQATRIMTGAPIPQGADAVVMVERSRMLDEQHVALEDKPKSGQNILPRAREMRIGETVLRAGAQLRPQEFGLLAAVGRSRFAVYPRPTVALVPTGDEVVLTDEKPGPGQIRNSNGSMLIAQVARAGGVPRFLGIGRDHPESLGHLIQEGFRSDALVLSGGVSAGKLDLVPRVLAELGVDIRFRQVVMKPGKPMLFGVRHDGERTTLVFGLPGNPVSSLVCFELFVRPALRKLAGHAESKSEWMEAELTEDYHYRTDRPTYHPVQLTTAGKTLIFRAVPWFGSPDLRGVLSANAFALFPAGDHEHRAGQVFPVLKLDEM